VIVREFRVNVGCEKDFELVFGPGGVWAALVQVRSEGYVRTEVQLVEDRRFRVLDYWQSHWDFEAFRDSWQQDIEQFRQWLANKEFVEIEKFEAWFYEDESGGGDEAGSVPS